MEDDTETTFAPVGAVPGPAAAVARQGPLLAGPVGAPAVPVAGVPATAVSPGPNIANNAQLTEALQQLYTNQVQMQAAIATSMMNPGTQMGMDPHSGGYAHTAPGNAPGMPSGSGGDAGPWHPAGVVGGRGAGSVDALHVPA